jgi:hypothetical protein
MFEADLRTSQEIQQSHFADQSLRVRVQAKLARLASPLL